jgi:hypothetical protein
MTKKEQNHPKIDLLLKEREDILEGLREIDEILLSRNDVDFDAVAQYVKRVQSNQSFSKLSNWLKPKMQINPDSTEKRVENVLRMLEKEFPAPPNPLLLKDKKDLNPDKVSDLKEPLRAQSVDRSYAIHFTMILLDNAILLHVLDHNTSAIIELYGALERFTINTLCDLLIIPKRVGIGLKLIERRTLPDISSLLSDCGVFDKEHTKFCNRLSRLRNGLAHRNAEVVSRSILGGKDIGELELDVAVSDDIFYEYLIGTVKACIAIFIYQSEEENIEPIPIGYFSENNFSD